MDFLKLRDSYQNFLATLRSSDSPWDLKAKLWVHILFYFILFYFIFLLFKLLLNIAQCYNTNVTWHCMILHYNKLQIQYVTLHYEL